MVYLSTFTKKSQQFISGSYGNILLFIIRFGCNKIGCSDWMFEESVTDSSKFVSNLHCKKWTTLPETDMAPENRYLEKEIPIGNHHLKVPC